MSRYTLFAISVTLIASVLSGCSSQKDNTKDDATTAQAPIEEKSMVLVWHQKPIQTLDRDPEYVTKIYQKSANQYKEIKSTDTLWLPSDSGVWTLETQDVVVNQLDCSCAESKKSDPNLTTTTEHCPVQKTVKNFYLKNLTTQNTLPIVERASSSDGQDIVRFKITGSVNQIVTTEICNEQYICGAAHPSTTCTFVAYDLNKMTTVNADQIAQQPDGAAVQAAYQKDILTLDQSPIQDTEFTLVSAYPHWDESGQYRTAAVMNYDAANADNDGRWSSYSRSVILDTKSAYDTEALTLPTSVVPNLISPDAKTPIPMGAANCAGLICMN